MADETPRLLTDLPLSSSLSDIPIEITVSVGRARPPIRDLLALREHAVLPLDKRIEDPVDIFVGDRLIARGELEEVEGGEPGQLAVRLTEVAAGLDPEGGTG